MKGWNTYLLAVLVSLFIGISGAYGGDIGELDTTFGDDGIVVTAFGDFGDQAYAAVLQSDGKILAAGSSSNGFDLDLAIARYNEDGSLDTSFSDDGKLKTSLGDGNEEITAIAVQDDNYIVAAGYIEVDGGKDFVLVRFTPDGDFDNSFGEGGMVITEFGNLDDEITAIFIDKDGSIFASGYVTGTAGRVVTVARYRKNGDLDVLFGDEGVVLIDVGGDALANSIDVDEDGKIVVAGSYDHAERTELMVLRLLENGDLDTGFGKDGIAVPADAEMASEGFGVRFMEDGRVMAAGSIGTPGDLDAAVFKFTEAGQPDTTFGDEGVLVTSAGEEDDRAYAIDVLDNVIGLSGYNTFNTKQDFLFVSIEEKTDEGANVSLNLNTGNFPTGGRKYSSVFDLTGQDVEPAEDEAGQKSVFSSTAIGSADDVSYAIVLQADGKAISAGSSTQDKVSSFAVARYITPVANAVSKGSDTSVSWITTREPTNVNRTGAFTGGTIFADGLTIEKRGVVFSIAPDPVYEEATDGTDDPGTTDTTAPTISNGSPSGELDSGTTSITMAVNTNENASCRYSTDSGINYNSMTDVFNGANTKSHSVLVDSLVDGESYTFYVRCEDTAGNANTSDFTISFSVRIGPNISNGSPTGELDAGTTDETLKVTTDVDATCKYSETAGTVYDSMLETFDTTGTTAHSEPITALEDDTSYTYYVRCEDGSGVQNETDYIISFSVAAAAARVPLAVNTVSLKIFDFPDTISSADNSYLTREPASPEEPVDAGPVVSNGSPYGKIAAGTSMTYIGVYTDEKADCMYSPLPGLEFGSMSEAMATADHLSHIAKVTGLQDEYSYSYYVRCRDFSGSESHEDFEVSFSVASPEDNDTSSFRRVTKNISNFLIAVANAQDTVPDTTPDETDTSKPTSVFDLSAPEYVIEGSTDDGGGNGSYSSILKDLKPGTFYYVRAYAVDDNGDVYYGNQLGFKTADSCFVATAAYGTLLHPYVKVLRSFRDQYLVTNMAGRTLVNLYYHFSPPLADYIAARPAVRGIARVALLPFIGMGWLVLQIGFTGLALLTLLIIMPSVLVCRSYRRLENY